MAEAIAALGLVASILQVVDYGNRVIVRLKDFRSSIVEAPKAFRDILVQLPLILDALERTRLQAESGDVDKVTQNALLPVVQGCYVQIRKLHKLLAKVMPERTDGSLQRSKKAFQSVGYEKTIKEMSYTLGNYVQTLTYDQATSHASLQSQVQSRTQIQPQKPFFGVPFDRDRKFIGRAGILKEVEDAIKDYRNIALAGIGGIGKSQIAIEAGYRYKDMEPNGHVFWLHASTIQRFDQGYRDVGRRFLPLPDAKDNDYNVLQSVQDWLSEHGPWLLILDNADDLELFFTVSEQTKPIINYLPHNPKGCLLITSRDKRVGERLAGRDNCITVLPPDEEEAEQLLRSKTAPEIWDSRAAGILIESLERLPLAISQAAAFISENSLTLDEYLESFLADDSKLVALLSEDSGDVRRDVHNGNSVMKTWKLSFDQISRQKPRAADILSLMAVLDRHGVPRALLEHQDERKTEFMTAIGTLQAFSLISTEKTNRNTFDMHRLVQLAMKLWLISQGKWADWQRKALLRLESQFPVYSFELSPLCEVLYPHARLAAEYRFEDPPTRLVRASLMTQMASYEASRYNLEIAHGRLTSACECREELLGRDHILTLRSRLHLAGTLRMQGSFEAEPIYRELLPKFEELTGEDANDALVAKMNLALSLKDDVEAEKLLREVTISAQKAGEMENYAIALDNLSVCLLNQGKRDESLKFHEMALEVKEKLLGPNHMSTLLSMMNLNAATDPSEKEERLSREILTKQEQILGPEHPDTLLSLINLSRRLMREMRYEEAEPLALRALAGRERVLGAKHPQTLIAMDTVAVLYSFMEQYEISKVYFERALRGFDKVLGQDDGRTRLCWWGYLALPPEWCSLDKDTSKEFAADHPVSIVRLNYEASKLYDKGDYRRADERQRKALALFESTLGRDELWTLACAHDLGLTLIELWNFTEAEELFRRVLAGRKKQLKPDHRDTLRAMNAFGVVLWNLKGEKLVEAEALFRDLLAIRERLGQTQDVSYLATRNNLGLLEFERGDNRAALKTYRDLLVDREKIQGPDHPETLLCMLSISMALGYEGEYEEARKWNEKSLMGLTINPGPEHPNTLVAQSHLAKILSMLGKLEKAEKTIRSVIATREKVLGPGHGNTLKSRGRLGGILEMQGRFDEALALEEDVYAVAVESLGIDHYETRGHKSSLDDLKYRMSQGAVDMGGSVGADPDVSQGGSTST